MKLVSLAAMTLATIATSAAFAATKTEYYFQPAASQSSVELSYAMSVQPRKNADTAGVETDNKLDTNVFNLNYAYGLSDTNTLGAYISTGSVKSTVGTVSSTASGMGDFHLFYEGSSDIWHYGLDLGLSTAKGKFDTVNTSAPGNRSSGGHSAKAFVGVMMSADAMNYGADLSYTYLLERTIESGTTEVKVKDGNTVRLAPFVEYNYGFGWLGAELSYAMVGDRSVTIGGVNAGKYKGETVTGLAVNGSYDFNEMATGLLTVGMNMHGSHAETDATGSDTVKGYTETIASLGARLLF